jgi:hypothetical protein
MTVFAMIYVPLYNSTAPDLDSTAYPKAATLYVRLGRCDVKDPQTVEQEHEPENESDQLQESALNEHARHVVDHQQHERCYQQANQSRNAMM